VFERFEGVQLSPDAHNFLARLAADVANAPGLKLAFVGYDLEKFDRKIRAMAAVEPITAIGIADVIAHLKYACEVRQLPVPRDEQLTRYAQSVLPAAKEMVTPKELALRVLDLIEKVILKGRPHGADPRERAAVAS
jgi:hypothetical protein